MNEEKDNQACNCRQNENQPDIWWAQNQNIACPNVVIKHTKVAHNSPKGLPNEHGKGEPSDICCGTSNDPADYRKRDRISEKDAHVPNWRYTTIITGFSISFLNATRSSAPSAPSMAR